MEFMLSTDEYTLKQSLESIAFLHGFTYALKIAKDRVVMCRKLERSGNVQF